MDSQKSREQPATLYRAGDLNFIVATSCEDDQHLIESLLFDLRTLEPPVGDISAFTFLRPDNSDDPRWHVTGPRVPSHEPTPDLGAALGLLIAGLNVSALDAQPQNLHLHAAAATRGDAAVVIAAERNTGKTTTVAFLIERGWEFITDETVSLDPQGEGISGFAKPLSVKHDGQEHLQRFREFMLPAGDDRAGLRFVPVSSTGAAIRPQAQPRLLVLLRRDRTAAEPSPVGYRTLHPVDAVVALMQETLDADRYGHAALRLAHLASQCRSIEVQAGSPSETADVIEQAFALADETPLAVTQSPPSPAFRESVTTILIGDRVVVHDLESGRIFALDQAGTKVWQKLAVPQEHPDIDLNGPVIAPLVAQLASLGVLANDGA